MKNKKLKLSLVIPVFNEQDHLSACLDSVLNQSVMPEEVIVVDNGSSDRSVEIAKSYPFVKLVHEPKRGVLHARTTGFNAAKGDIIGRIDADTLLPPRWVENVIAGFKNTACDGLTGPVNYYDMPFPVSNHYPDHLMRSSIYHWSPKSPFLFGSNMAIRRAVWVSIQGQLCRGQDFHEDLDLAIHLDRAGYSIYYDKSFLAGASGRRYNDSPRKFYRYMSMYRRTYLGHGLHSLAIYSATGVYWLGYVLVHPLRNIWYRAYSLSRPLVPLSRISRKNPMEIR